MLIDDVDRLFLTACAAHLHRDKPARTPRTGFATVKLMVVKDATQITRKPWKTKCAALALAKKLRKGSVLQIRIETPSPITSVPRVTPHMHLLVSADTLNDSSVEKAFLYVRTIHHQRKCRRLALSATT